ncbi:MAG: hypothetical protein AB8B72_04915 [Crocinitomicaceae bacterium]
MTKSYLKIFNILLLFSLTYSCCDKGRYWTLVDIAIKDTSNNIVEYANVALILDGQLGIPKSFDENIVQTDFEGVSHFDLSGLFEESETQCIVGEVEVVLLNLEGTSDSLSGTKTIIIEGNSTNDYEVIIQ